MGEDGSHLEAFHLLRLMSRGEDIAVSLIGREEEDRGLEIEKVIEVEIDIRARDPEDGVVVQDRKIEDVRDHLEDGKHRRKGPKR